MAGIKGNSSRVTMADGDTATTQTQAGYGTAERITLTTTGSPTSVTWTLSPPTNSAHASLVLSGNDAYFVPDVAGQYAVAADADGTEYALLMSVTVIGAVTMRNIVHFAPVDPDDVPTPTVGAYVFSSLAAGGRMVEKRTDGNVYNLG